MCFNIQPRHRTSLVSRELSLCWFCIGATFGHYSDNWLVDDYRKAVVYAICWTEHLPIPVDGIQTTWVEDAVVGEALGSTPSPNLSPLEPTRPPPDPAYAKK